MGDYAFSSCTNLRGSLTIQPGIQTIPTGAFEHTKLTGSLTIPDTVTSVANYAFMYTNFDGTLTLSNSLETIGQYGFSAYFTGELNIPASVNSIGENAFSGSNLDCVRFLGTAAPSVNQNTFSTTARYPIFYPNASTSYTEGVWESLYSDRKYPDVYSLAAKPNATLDVITKTLSGVDSSIKYKVYSSDSWKDVPEGATSVTVSLAMSTDVQVVRKGDGGYILDSAPQIIKVTQGVISGTVTKTNCTNILNNDGTMAGVTDQMEYKLDSDYDWTPVPEGATVVTGLRNGKYYVRVKATSTMLPSNSITIYIEAFVGTKEATPNAIFTATGTNNGILSGVDNTMVYSVNGDSAWIAITGTSMDITGVTPAKGIKVKRLGNGSTTTDSDIQTITVTKVAIPTASAIDCTNALSQDGKILGVSDQMEYKPASDSDWTSVPESATEITGLGSGIYHLRVKASGTRLASETQIITIRMQEATPAATFTATGSDKGTLSNVDSSMLYSLNGITWQYVTGTSMDISGVTTNGIMVMKLGNGTTTTDSEIQTIIVTKAAKPNLTPTQPSVIGGLGSIPMTFEHEYSADNGSTWQEAVGETTLAEGTYYVRVRANGTTLASEYQTITLEAFNGTKETTPSALVDYAAEKLTGLMEGAVYTVNGTITAGESGTIVIPDAWFGTTINIVRKGNGTTTIDSDVQTIGLEARPSVPSCTVTQPSASSATGTISGITSAMQYSTNGGSTWMDGNDADVTGLAPGTVLIRVKATLAAPAGRSQSITITAYTPPSTGGGGSGTPAPTPTPTPTPAPSEDTYVFTPSLITEMLEGNQKINIDNGLQLNADLSAIPRNDGDTIIIKVSEIKDSESLNDFYDTYPTQKALFKGYDVDFIIESNKQMTSVTQLTDEITMKFQLTEEEVHRIDINSLKVYKVSDDGTITVLTGTFDPETLTYTVTTDHLCYFYLMAQEAPDKPWMNPFTDVLERDWFYSAIKFVHQRLLFVGTSSSTFSPHSPMTRAMLWTVLGRLDGQNLTGSDAFEKARLWAAGRGITDGTNPDGNITREQMVTILWRYAGSPAASGDLSRFSDSSKVSSYAVEAMAWAVENGIINGADGKLLPQDNATRSQVAAILQRFVDALEK